MTTTQPQKSQKQVEIMDFKQIKTDLENGKNFESESEGWYTLNKKGNSVHFIYTMGQYKQYANLSSVARAVKKLMKQDAERLKNSNTRKKHSTNGNV